MKIRMPFRGPWAKKFVQLSVVGILLFATVGFVYKESDNYFEIAKNIDIFSKVLREVNANYVDEIEPNQLVKVGVDAMLRTLDPYTDYITANEIDDYRFISTGQYGGIGAKIEKYNREVYISEPYEDSPAQKMGLQAGDQLLKVDNETIEGKDMDPSQVRDLLRGQAKTKVKITVRRYNVPEPLVIEVERQDFKVKNVDYYGFVQDDIGYISLNGFTKDASIEVKHALEALRSQNPHLKGVVLDLRDNPGGLLYEAIGIANLFVKKGEKLVETRGRMEGSYKLYEATSEPLDVQIPLAVIINENSASASEIVAGVMQDLDRGVIVGQRSYGKGLVQNTRPLSYNTQLKITTARYFTPSGRCIQAINYKHNDKDGGVVRVADSLKTEYKTRNGRSVRDAGGIDPDIAVDEEDLPKIVVDLFKQHMVFEYATQYHAAHPSLVEPKAFHMEDADYTNFVSYLSAHNFTHQSKSEESLTSLKESLKKESFSKELETDMNHFEELVKRHSANDIYSYKKEILPFVQQEIASRYYYQRGRLEASFQEDKELRAAIQVLQDPQHYQAILTNTRPVVKEK